MTIEVKPKGTRGGGLPPWMLKFSNRLMVWIARRSGGERMVVLTTVGARTGRQHTVQVGRFAEPGGSFLVIASNMGGANHPAWYFNIARNPDQVWAEVGGRKFKVRPQQLEGADRTAAFDRVIAEAPGFANYQRGTDREIPVIRLIPE